MIQQQTSLDALKSTDTCKQRAEVLAWFKQNPLNGLTCDDIEYWAQLGHGSASARVHELMQLGEIVDSGNRRKTRHGKSAIVWLIAGGQKDLFHNPRKTVSDLRKACIQAAIFARSTGVWASFNVSLEELRRAESK